jgi:hypothetical protein
VKKFVLIAMIGMLATGASFVTVTAQNQPTGAPDTSVTSRPPRLSTQTTAPVTAPQPKQEIIKEPKITSTTMVLGIAGTVLIAGIAVVLIRRNKTKK